MHPSGYVLKRLVHLEGTKSACASGVHDTLWNALMVEAVDLLASGMILEEHRPGVVIVNNFEPVVCCIIGSAIVI